MEISKDKSKIGPILIKQEYLRQKNIYPEGKGNIILIDEKQKEKVKNKVVENKYLNDEFKNYIKLNKEKNIFYFKKKKHLVKNTSFNENFNYQKKIILLTGENSKKIKEKYVIEILIKIVILAIIFRIIFFSLFNMNIDLTTELFFSLYNKEIIMLCLITIIGIIIIFQNFKYILQDIGKTKYEKYFLKSIKANNTYFLKNKFNIKQTNSIKDNNINGNKLFKINNNVTKKQIVSDKKNINKNNNNIIIIKKLIKIILIEKIFNQISTYNIIDLFSYQSSKITLKIKRIGSYNIFGEPTDFNSSYYPDEIYINGNRTDIISYNYNFTQRENYVELIWINSINNCKNMFKNCFGINEINLSNFDTSQVTDMSYMFSSCSNLASLNVSNFDTSKVTDMSYMFRNYHDLASLDLSNFDTSKVNDMSNMFISCSNLDSLNLSSFDTSKVTDMSNMFSHCSDLTYLDLSTFETSKVTDMSYMFVDCLRIISLDLSNFNTQLVINMNSMFHYCRSLIFLNLSNFNTSLVSNMYRMFWSCKSLISLDLFSFNTSLVINMDYMFSDCSLLTSLDLSNFNISKVRNMHGIFAGCLNLKYIINHSDCDIIIKINFMIQRTTD